MSKFKLTGQGGKGSARRQSNEKAYADNWDLIFNKDKKDDNESKEVSTEKSKTQPKA
jgi:hypothetical protein